MKTLSIDGQMFKGPYRLDESEFPDKPALAIVATESGEGIQILSFIESDDIAKEIADNKHRDCWKKNGWNGKVDVYIQFNDNKPQRQMLRKRMADKRRESIKCEDFLKPDFE